MVVHGGQDGNHDVDLDGSGATPLTVEDPRQIGPYPLVGLLGAGGMGRVYLGVAEGRYGRQATEYIPGLTLTEAVRLQDGPLPGAALWYLLRELARRLRALHALDMLHRDVKPSNVMIELDGLALIDFGIARAADQSRLTRTGMVLGTPEYMAPQQAQGQKEDACGSNSGQYWRIGSTKSSGSTLESTTYSQCMEVVPTSSAKVTACDPADSAQLWGYAGRG